MNGNPTETLARAPQFADMHSIEELLNAPNTARKEWVINDFLARQNIMLVLGPPKTACKSWLLYNLAWDIGEGRHIWNATQSPHGRPEPRWKPPHPMRVVYFCQEDTRDDIQERLRLLAGSGGRTPHANVYPIPKDLSFTFDSDVGWDKIWKRVEASFADLVIFDPLRRFHAGDENDSRTTQRMWMKFDSLMREFDCSIALAHHNRKPGKDSDQSSPFEGRGTSDLYGGSDLIISVSPGGLQHMRTERTLTLNFEAKRTPPLQPLTLVMDFKTGLISAPERVQKRSGGDD
jgi:RecA-family ATPase